MPPEQNENEINSPQQEVSANAPIDTKSENEKTPGAELAEKAEKIETPPPEEKKDDGEGLDFFLKRIGELETEKKTLNTQIFQMKEAEETRKSEMLRVEIERREAARNSVLMDEYKILKPEYMALAPSSEHADPMTEEGRESLRQWVNSNPGLFGRAPDLPNSEDTQSPKSIFSNRGWTWADKWRDSQ